ncbi:hypothetical protein Sjap_015756 [Stephania japonica]|uniref:non-specific serine/threonine protein kinase n=1 Tax=Stephania japonica TaxID=461633 RepID=A0AAP0IJT0_9MAGN
MESFLSNVVFFVTTLVVAMNIFLVHSSFSSNDTSRSSDVVKASMQDQVDALLAWKRSLTFLYGNTPLNSWSTDTALYPTVCDWEGIACDGMGRLVRIELHSTSLKGNLENFNFSSFPDLLSLNLGDNRLNGSIPSQIGNLTKLTMLDLSFNDLIGSIPQSIGQLRSLLVLDLSNNLLTGSIPTTIGTMLNLSELHLSSNQLVGSLPQSIGQLKSLLFLHISINKLIGPIPATIGNMTKLEKLELSSNQLVGSLPQSIGQLKSLFSLDLSSNQLAGSLPQSIGQLKSLFSLDLSSNQLVGSLPQSIGQLKSLFLLYLPINKLIGPIPATIGNMTKLEYLELSSNQLVGSIPQSIGQLKSLVSLHLSTNKLTGPIPTTIGDMSSLSWLSLRENQINGSIPEELWKFTQLEELDLSSNHLSGDLPNSYCSMYSLIFFNLSQNKIKSPFLPNGILPYRPRVLLNNGECVEASKVKENINKRKPKRLIIIFLATTLLVFVLIGVLLGSTCRWNSRKARTNEGSTKHGNIFSIWNYDGHIAYEDIIRETEDFDIKYCIGVGGYGSVYRALLPSGKVVALKKFHNWERENLTFERSFTTEIQVLTTIRHRNIVKLYGFCCHTQCAFLVYEYLEKGSLFVVLAEEVEAVVLDWKKRINIIKGISCALSYLHHDCSPPILHRDISSNNILLDSEYEAHVADFGTAKLLDPDSSNQTILAGTYGYIAPGILNC